jgi:hypothetical protein
MYHVLLLELRHAVIYRKIDDGRQKERKKYIDMAIHTNHSELECLRTNLQKILK